MLGTAKQAGLLQALHLTLLKSSRLDRRALLRDFIGNLPPQRLLKQKLQSLTNIVNSKIFQSYGEKGHRGSELSWEGHGTGRGRVPAAGTPPLPRDRVALQKEAIPSSLCWNHALPSPCQGAAGAVGVNSPAA